VAGGGGAGGHRHPLAFWPHGSYHVLAVWAGCMFRCRVAPAEGHKDPPALVAYPAGGTAEYVDESLGQLKTSSGPRPPQGFGEQRGGRTVLPDVSSGEAPCATPTTSRRSDSFLAQDSGGRLDGRRGQARRASGPTRQPYARPYAVSTAWVPSFSARGRRPRRSSGRRSSTRSTRFGSGCSCGGPLPASTRRYTARTAFRDSGWRWRASNPMRTRSRSARPCAPRGRTVVHGERGDRMGRRWP
jgi:hypothetical protein